jgi:hypothetical protein
VNAEFNWWLLIVGLVIGAGLVWLVLADSRRGEADVPDDEREGEARWIADGMASAGRLIDDEDVLEVLRLHAEYLAAGPPDAEPGTDEPLESRPVDPERRGIERTPMAHPLPRPDDGDGGLA